MMKFYFSFLLSFYSFFSYSQQLSCNDLTGCINTFDVCETDVQIPFPDTLGFCEMVTITITSDMPNHFDNQDGTGIATGVPPGVYTVTYTATDNCGNSATCEAPVTVVDCKLPIPFCDYDIQFFLSGSPAEVTVEASQLDAGSFDNCTASEDLIFSFSSDTTDNTLIFGTGDIGFQELELWVTDENGNQDFCFSFIIINSVNVDCENIQTCILGDDCMADVVIPTIGTTACDNLELNFDSDIPDLMLNSDGSGMISDLEAGSYFINLDFSDDCYSGNFCNLTITVEDCEAPMMSCQGMNIVFDDASMTQTVLAKELDDGSTDNCTATPNLRYSFSEDVTDTMKTFSCVDIGSNDIVLIVTDEADVQGFCNTTIEVEHAIPYTVDQALTSVSCFGEMDGMIDLTVTGLPPISFDWSNGATTEDIDNLSPGDYSVIVTEGCGVLSNTFLFTIEEPQALTLFDTILTHPTTSSTTDGIIVLEIAGGAFPYTYNWSNGATTSTIVELTMGDYDVTVTDTNGCMFETTITLNATTGTNNLAALGSIKLTPNISKIGTPVQLMTDFQKREVMEIQYLNVSGKTVATETKIIAEGMQNTELNVPTEKGIYFVAIKQVGQGGMQTFKLIIL